MRIGALIREALATAWAAKIPSGLVALVAAAMCFVALSTVGQHPGVWVHQHPYP